MAIVPAIRPYRVKEDMQPFMQDTLKPLSRKSLTTSASRVSSFPVTLHIGRGQQSAAYPWTFEKGQTSDDCGKELLRGERF